ncbi:hypothetical protein ACFV3R_19245 [Streptomyces sp. NPDC059740]|uniref:hypothetical protein n=1 Tax=Streptomyces sp. NPDC059740 TaxID=3346926 RepID=UPI0036507C49
MSRPHDPATDPEAEGVPDLQAGSPEQQQASDPEQMPVPGDDPTVAESRGNTANEAWAGDSLAQRLAEEIPEGPTEVLAAGPGADYPEEDVDASAEDPGVFDGTPEERAGLLDDVPDPDRPRDQDVYAEPAPSAGLSAEEDAVRVTDQDSALAADRGHERTTPAWENASALADEATVDDDRFVTGAVSDEGNEEPTVWGAEGAGDADTGERARAALREAATGKGGHGTAPIGNAVIEPEIAEGPVPGLEPGERIDRGSWEPPLEVDAPADPAAPGASGDPDAVRRQKEAGGP